MKPPELSGTAAVWNGITPLAQSMLHARDYSLVDLAQRISSSGVAAGDLAGNEDGLRDEWIPGVEIFRRMVFQQKGRGCFSELVRLEGSVLDRIGLFPMQWASAMMHRDSAKGFHIHPPHVPIDEDPDRWFQKLFCGESPDCKQRPYSLEQWDVMFFLTGICEMILVDERRGLPRRVMRFSICGDSRPGPDNVGVVIPAGVAHAIRCIGDESVMMVYGTSTVFNPSWEGRIASGVEDSVLPAEWRRYLEGSHE
jgi:dTDP-4-dehydrorhamnose 3,5-epimerase-like enzyme